jgi:para-aminobenzoate synthetase/4-amino-4-deoxychorismate lyase
MPPFARLDSAAVGGDAGRSFAFVEPRGEIVAYALDEVVPAVRAVEAAVAQGEHAAGYIAYEAAPAFALGLATRAPAAGLPLLWFGVFARRVAVDPVTAAALDADASAGGAVGPLAASVSEDEYRAALAELIDEIASGDLQQVNHTFRLRASWAGDEGTLYRALLAAQRPAYGAWLRLPRFSILSASPELFFRRRGDHIELRPMKGTRPRGRWSAEDRRLAAELGASAKERAENDRTVALLLDELASVCAPGSVRVPSRYDVETYPTLHQMTSTVAAELRRGTRLEHVLGALFPPASIAGVPKARAAQRVAALEDSPRGVYTGAIGFISPDESVFNVAIRTLVLDREHGTLELGVGSGISAGSDPGAEYRECLLKAAFVHHRAPDFALLETLRYERPAGYFLLDRHLARLAESAAYFGFRLDRERVRARLEALGAALGEGRHRVRLALERTGEIEIEHAPVPSVYAPLRVAIARTPIDERDARLYHKTTARDLYRSRAAEWPEHDEVLLLNRRGELTEATTANLVVQLDGERVTPPLEAGLLPGVLRAELLERGEVAERRLTPAELERAEAIWLVSALRGWREAVLER